MHYLRPEVINLRYTKYTLMIFASGKKLKGEATADV